MIPPPPLPLRSSLLFALLLSVVVELMRIVANEKVICRCGKKETLKRNVWSFLYLLVSR